MITTYFYVSFLLNVQHHATFVGVSQLHDVAFVSNAGQWQLALSLACGPLEVRMGQADWLKLPAARLWPYYGSMKILWRCQLHAIHFNSVTKSQVTSIQRISGWRLGTWLTFLARPLLEAQPCSTCCALVLRHTWSQMKVHNVHRNINNISDECRYMSLLLTYYVIIM